MTSSRMTTTFRRGAACTSRTLYENPAATLDDVREAVTTLEDDARVTRRVFGGTHPLTDEVGGVLLRARAILDAREMPSPPVPAPG